MRRARGGVVGSRYDEDVPEPVLLRMNKVEPQPLEWLWPGRLPLGTVSLLVGDPGQGKSLVAMDIAARVSRGLPWPDEAPLPPEGEEPRGNTGGAVLLLSADDDLGSTVRPRLEAAGADLDAIAQLCAVQWANGRGSRRFSLTRDLAALEQAMLRGSCVRLVVIDPVSAYMGRGEVASDGAVHDVLAPLGVLAARTGAAVLAVSHLNKRSAGLPVHRAAGSMSFVAAARAVWAVASDLQDPERHLLLPVKSNLSALGTGLGYRIVGSAGQGGAPRVAWERTPVALTSAEALAAVAGRELSERQAAALWLRDVLAHGPVAVKEIGVRAKRCGIARSAMRRAKGLVGIVAYSTGFQENWMWRLPGQSADAPPGVEVDHIAHIGKD